MCHQFGLIFDHSANLAAYFHMIAASVLLTMPIYVSDKTELFLLNFPQEITINVSITINDSKVCSESVLSNAAP